MTAEFASFAFIATLAAVINGLGIVRWLNALTEILRTKESLAVDYYSVYILSAIFQFILHVLLWWSLWSLRGSGTLNFLTYLYLLTGPILMFVGTAFLTPVMDSERLDLRRLYYAARPAYSTVVALFWLWAILAQPVFRGHFADQAPILAIFLAIAVTQRSSANNTVHQVAAVLNWLVLVVFVLVYAMELGGMAPKLD